MEYKRFSHKQLVAMMWWQLQKYQKFDALICDGSVRSGKTISMTIGFIMWSMSCFDRQSFAICGKTIESLRRNVITPMHTWLEGVFVVTERVSKNYVEISGGGKTNRYYLFGGRDESSASLIQGLTIAGVLFDEVALMPRSFVEQALARCSIAGSRYWFNCNPEGPGHWFYNEWILKPVHKNALHLHFTMDDNLSLPVSVKERYERLYTGVFYDRFVKGMWCVAEGLVYGGVFDEKKHVVNNIPKHGEYYISCDYGTLNPFSAGLWCWDGEKATRIREYYYSGRNSHSSKTDEEYYMDLEQLAGNLPIDYIVVDPSAASFIETIRRHGKYSVRKAKNDVLDGIRLTSMLLRADRLLFCDCCKDSIREFALYRWDDKGELDKPIKENDHAMDDIRYFCSTVLRRKLRHIPELR